MRLSRLLWKLGNFVEPYGLLPKVYYRGRSLPNARADADPATQYPAAIARRYARYQAAEIPIAISRHDDMYIRGLEGNLDHYLQVGRGAVDIIVAAMAAADRSGFGKILDLPCGGGRVTRHLRAMFPDATIFVSELDRRKEDFVVETFGVQRAPANPEFELEPAERYDLVFCGSLLTHLDAERTRRAIAWFCRALAPGGLAILTTHGRHHDERQTHMHYVDAEKWAPARAAYRATGFGFAPCPTADYGVSVCSAEWLTAFVETLPDVRILMFREAAWDNHQDVLVVQRSG